MTPLRTLACVAALAAVTACDREQRPVTSLGQLTCADLQQVVQDERDAATVATVTQAGEIGGAVGVGAAAITQAIPIWGTLAYVAVVGALKLAGFLDSDATAHEAEARTAETVMFVKQVADFCDARVADGEPVE